MSGDVWVLGVGVLGDVWVLDVRVLGVNGVSDDALLEAMYGVAEKEDDTAASFEEVAADIADCIAERGLTSVLRRAEDCPP